MSQLPINSFISNLHFYPLISTSDISNINNLTLILKISGECDVKHTIMLPIITSDLKVPTYIITSITARLVSKDNVCLDLQNWQYSIFLTPCIISINTFSGLGSSSWNWAWKPIAVLASSNWKKNKSRCIVVSDCCLMPNEQFFSCNKLYSMRWW